MDEDDNTVEADVWRKEIRPLEKDEVLEVSPGCYEMLYNITLDWSCLSFDILRDDLGGCRVEYPHECYVVAGTQPSTNADDQSLIHVMKWSNLLENAGEEEDEDEVVVFKVNSIKHPGLINRIKACPQNSRLAVTMAATGKAHIWDIHDTITKLKEDIVGSTLSKSPLFTNGSHSEEGYAVSWNPHTLGTLISGDCRGDVFLWTPVEGGWDIKKFVTNSNSVEDLQWKDKFTFSAAYSDGVIRLFDVRNDGSISFQIKASQVDINSTAWNPFEAEMILCGDENGLSKIYDIRYPNDQLAELSWHKEAITSVDWHPHESCTLALSSRDDSISIWDISVEAQDIAESNIPQQLMFVHMGQTEITEVTFHRQIPGVLISTALDGLNIFKPINI